jgi:hypothetical protein
MNSTLSAHEYRQTQSNLYVKYCLILTHMSWHTEPRRGHSRQGWSTSSRLLRELWKELCLGFLCGIESEARWSGRELMSPTKPTVLGCWSGSGLAISAVEPTTAGVNEFRSGDSVGRCRTPSGQVKWRFAQDGWKNWMWVAKYRTRWREIGEAYVQQWTVVTNA